MAMRIDVSEIKTYRECKRKHQFSSRNRFHLVPTKPADNLIFGTQFHEILHSIYLGVPLDKILAWIDKEITDPVYWKTATAMAEGYYKEIYLPQDKDRYKVIDIEKAFEFPITGDSEIVACGSIDMIALDVQTNELVGFEHKTAKNFRPDVYNFVDEQPRLYSVALRKILEEYKKTGRVANDVTIGPIYLNQVKKLQRSFDACRTECRYSEEDLSRFMKSFVASAKDISEDNKEELPEPGYMKCQMCDYADLCMHYGYAPINKDELLDEFEGEYHEREVDHLDEKSERAILQSPDPNPDTNQQPGLVQVSVQSKKVHVDFGGN
jgi:CRISPR/Cas system-associated exonuclease Cas4 (RecB family)